MLITSASPAHAIINGVDAVQLKGQVEIQAPGGSCTGTLISAFWVLTARHCVEGEDPRDIKVYAGSLLFGRRGNEFSLKQRDSTTPANDDLPVYLNSTTDTALLRLASGVPASVEQAIPYGIDRPEAGADAQIRGFGADALGQPPTRLQFGLFTVREPVRQSTTPPGNFTNSSAVMMLQASPLAPDVRVSLGDSGAGVMINNTLCGVVSAQETNPTPPTYRPIVARTEAIAQWIATISQVQPPLGSTYSCRSSQQKAQPLKVMSMGDKITVGKGVADGNGFRKGTKDRVLAAAAAGQLSVSGFDYVGSQSSGSMDDNQTEGYDGQTIQRIGDSMDCQVGLARPNLVLMELGYEDMEKDVSSSKAASRVRAVITKTLDRAPESTILVSTLPPSLNAAVQGRITQFNQDLTDEVERQQRDGKRVTVVNMGTVTPGDISGSLPTASGYDKMASAFYDSIVSSISRGWIQVPQSGDRTYCKELRTRDPLPAATVGRTNIQQPDPSVIQSNGTYYSVVSDPGPNPDNDYARIYVRAASSLENLDKAVPELIWSDSGVGEVWAPEIERIDGRFYVYFSMGKGTAHRMYVISSTSAQSGYGAEQKLSLPDDKWAIDGASFVFSSQRYFVWSGWAGDQDGQQNLYLAKMTSPTATTGERKIISEPAESWEKVTGTPRVNEGPEPIKDPNGQLHIVYSTNGSWTDQYCLADLRLKAGGDPMSVWDWYKSNGCEFGSNKATLAQGWDPTTNVNGPGHHTFVLPDGDINNSPPAIKNFPIMYHGVPKGMTYTWDNRVQYIGGALWWKDCTYSRQNVPGDNQNTGWSLKFFEDKNFNSGGNGGGCGPTTSPGQTTIHSADPSVIRVIEGSSSSYISAEADNGTIYVRKATTPEGLDKAQRSAVWSDGGNLGEVWAPEIQKIDGKFYIYFSAGRGSAHRMYVINSTVYDNFYVKPEKVALPDDKWAVDGTTLKFNGTPYFVWSGWEGDTDGEQNLYIAKMNGPASTTGNRYIISQPREDFENVAGRTVRPAINEAPEAIQDPDGRLHIVYSTNRSWTNEYCMAEIRLKAGGDPTQVWDWYKSNGCLFGSNRGAMMNGWDTTRFTQGPGHHSFILVNGTIDTSPPANETFPMMYHGVPNGTPYTWDNRIWYVGGFVWWGNINYTRGADHGPTTDTGWSLKFFEDRNFKG